jgi:tripartite-type tricarboxylate transporter receptor subunit TctC
MLPMVRSWARAAGVAFVVLYLAPAIAQTYPARPVHIIVPNSPGGALDVSARGVAQALSESLGQPFIVENRPGADGMIGSEFCVRAAPDGYVLCVNDGQTYALNPLIRAKMPYDPSRDLTPVTMLGILYSSIVATPSLAVNSIQELLALARAKPGSVTFANSGLTTIPSIYVEWYRKERGVIFQAVPYKTTPQALAAVIAGEVHLTTFAIGPASELLKARKVKVLAQSSPRRTRILPSVPTFAEGGMEVSLLNWFGLFAPSAIPRDLVRRLNADIAKNLFNVPAMRDKFLVSQGLELDPPSGGTPEEFAAFLRQDRENYAAVVKQAGIRVED